MNLNLQRAYDNAAEAYADRLFGELDHKPFDLAMLDRIIERHQRGHDRRREDAAPAKARSEALAWLI